MAMATRRLLRANIGAAAANADDESDTFEDEEPRGIGGGYRRHRQPTSPQGQRRSSVITDAPTNDESEHLDLARFLLMATSKDGRRSQRSTCDDSDGKAMMSMGTCSTEACALALEPIEIRSEKIVMLAEAYAIFGGLFLGGTWVLYEWGSPDAYGSSGSGSDPDDGTYAVYNRMFPIVLGVAIVCNIFLALYSSLLWLQAIVYGSRENFVFEARKYLQFCNILMWIVLFCVMFGCWLAALAYGERGVGEKNDDEESSIGTLLRTAAANLGRSDFDVSIIEARLEGDWFNEAVHLRNRSVECLSRYMPLRLAEEVHRLVTDSKLCEGVELS